MELEGTTAEAKEEPKQKHMLTCDEEAWILDRLENLCGLVYMIKSQKVVQADQGMITASIKGAINGAAEEIAYLCGAAPCYENFKHRQYPAPIENPLSKSAIWRIQLNRRPKMTKPSIEEVVTKLKTLITSTIRASHE